MVCFVEVLSYWEAHAVLPNCAPVIIEPRSEFGTCFPDVGYVGAFCAKQAIENVASITIVVRWVDGITRGEA